MKIQHVQFLLVILLTCAGCSAQVKVYNVPRVQNDTYFAAQTEPSVAVSPSDPDHIAVGSVLNSVYVSRKGGRKWVSHKMESKWGVRGDPCLLFDKDGRLYYFHLADVEGASLDRIVCQVSLDGDTSFDYESYPIQNGKIHDKEWVAYHPESDRMHMTWTQFDEYDSDAPGDSSVILYSHSSDQGKSWSTPVRLNRRSGNCLDSDGTVEGAVPAVGPSGQVYVCWALDENIYFNRSDDGGLTWLKKERKVADIIGGWEIEVPGIYRCNGMPVTCVDRSDSEYKGHIYVNWVDLRNGEDDPDVWLAKSTDGGYSWQDPVRVNPDTSRRAQFFTWMTVDPHTGFIYIVYYDRSQTQEEATDFMLSVSKDGGATFTQHKLSESSFTPNENIFFGDYSSVVTTKGRLYAAWARMDSKEISLKLAKVNTNRLH